MKKFDRITIECNDDGTMQVEIRPYIQRTKDVDMHVATEAKTKKITVNSLNELQAKIEATMKGASDKNDLKRYFGRPKSNKAMPAGNE